MLIITNFYYVKWLCFIESCNFNEDAQDTCFRAFKSSDGKDTKLNDAVQMSMSFKVF